MYLYFSHSSAAFIGEAGIGIGTKYVAICCPIFICPLASLLLVMIRMHLRNANVETIDHRFMQTPTSNMSVIEGFIKSYVVIYIER